MPDVQKVNVGSHSLVIGPDLDITLQERRPGPPQRQSGMTVGVIDMDCDPPHGGEVHPDGDEIIHVITGRFHVITESDPDHPIELGPGDSCIINRDCWHRVHVVEPGRLIHITPGPNGDHRPVGFPAS